MKKVSLIAEIRNLFALLLVVAIGVIAIGCAGKKTVSSIQLTPSSASLTAPGATVQFMATASYQLGVSSAGTANVTNQVTWTSSSPSVATVSTSGLATAVSAGSTTITATMQTESGPVSGSAELSVTSGPPTLTSITIIPAAGTQTVYAVGETAQFLAFGIYSASPTSQEITDSVIWQSSDVDVATINSSGLATAVGCSGPPPCVTNITATATSTDGTIIFGTSNLAVYPNMGSTNLPSLSVYPVGQGAGTINSTPVGISCGSGVSCTADFVLGSTVTLTATATSGVVLGFSSNCAPSPPIPANGAPSASCTVTMNGNQTVGVIFNQ